MADKHLFKGNNKETKSKFPDVFLLSWLLTLKRYFARCVFVFISKIRPNGKVPRESENEFFNLNYFQWILELPLLLNDGIRITENHVMCAQTCLFYDSKETYLRDQKFLPNPKLSLSLPNPYQLFWTLSVRISRYPINLFVPNTPFLYPLKCFHGVKKWCIGNEWVNSRHDSTWQNKWQKFIKI